MQEEIEPHHFRAMITAPQEMTRLSLLMQKRYKLGASAAYVGFKLVCILSRQVNRSLCSPSIALQFAERIRPILLELVLEYDSAELQRMLELNQDLIDELEREVTLSAMDKLLEGWREQLRR